MIPDNKVHGAHVGPTWAMSAPDGPYVGPMNFAIWDVLHIMDIPSEDLVDVESKILGHYPCDFYSQLSKNC